MSKSWKIWIDTGGTFTDCIALSPDQEIFKCKVLSSSALRGNVRSVSDKYHIGIDETWNAPDQFIKGFRFHMLKPESQILTVGGYDAKNKILEFNSPIPASINENEAFEVISPYEAPILAARLVTKTIPDMELPGIQMRLATTRGTNALLERKGVPVAFFTTAGHRDLLLIGNQQRPDLFALAIHKPKPFYTSVHEITGRIDAAGNEIIPLDTRSLKTLASDLVKQGIKSAAVCLMNSYRNETHELRVAELLRNSGFSHVSVSSQLSPFIKILLRAETSVVNAFLSPVIDGYLEDVYRHINRGSLYIMTSAGGLIKRSSYHAKDSLLSGPAGGVVGASHSGRLAGFKHIISFDMGGTSTDVSRFDGSFDYRFEHSVGDAHLAAPSLHIETVAAGGGSICDFDGFKLTVGPESAGANPGPACYGTGGPLTLTDVNLLLGHLDYTRFGIPINGSAPDKCLELIMERIDRKAKQPANRHAILSGYLEIANERMADAIRRISLRKGYNPADYTLVAFGGAGGQHACGVASKLGIGVILLPADSGLLSAYGLGNAAIERFTEQQILQPLEKFGETSSELFKKLEKETVEKVHSEGIPRNDIRIRRIIVNMRLSGQESSLPVDYQPEKSVRLEELFKERYLTIYGHWTERRIEVESVRVIASGKPVEARQPYTVGQPYKPDSHHSIHAIFGNRRLKVPVFFRETLQPGAEINAPALVLDLHSTTVVDPGWKLTVDTGLNMILKQEKTDLLSSTSSKPEAVNLQLFTNRFTAMATEMGEMLQRTALSVNVKERLDFSCAVLDSQGNLVVNAPHIPVHLGALGLCVREISRHISMNPGDVIITNHPAFGGSHLPDITMITPVFVGDSLLGYVASRAHHAEIGGISPGSMPPRAKNLTEEGVVIQPVKIMENGKSRWEDIREIFSTARYPSRNIEENMADLNAMMAANRRGAVALKKLCETDGADRIHFYMDHLKTEAEKLMRDTLRQWPDGVYKALEKLDDGTPLQATIHIRHEEAIIDFAGTGPRHPGNLNATPAIVRSVIIYVLRLLINKPMPLNEGLLKPVTIHIPDCLLNPGFPLEPDRCPAVVGGNTEVSQRLVDTLLKAFNRVACSQGTMNNILFGNDRFGFYETVCGGTGAGPDFDGTDAIHHHMTNTRITDAEIMEYRYPVRVDRFEVRIDSGGKGLHSGGNGVIRELTFLEPVSLSVLTQHRTVSPYGIDGGKPGSTGEQYVIHSDGRRQNLSSIDGCDILRGDRFVIKTPGGGGFGNIG